MAGSEVIARVRALKARSLSFEAYATELAALADIGPGDAETEAVDAAFMIVSLRKRLTILEQKVRELEARK